MGWPIPKAWVGPSRVNFHLRPGGGLPSVGHSMSDIPPDISHDQYAVRLKKLQELGRIDDTLARDLLDALHFLMGLRLSHQLRQQAGGARPGNEVKPSDLGALEREPLHDALAIVKRFRQFLRQHYRFDSL